MPRTPPAPSGVTVPPAIALILAVTVLYFARTILIPFALAILFSFLLSPVVKRLEQWRLPRIPAVLAVLLIAFGVVSGVGWIVADQLVDIVNKLPRYRDNVHGKVLSAQAPGNFSKLFENLQDIGKELDTRPASQPPVAAPRTPARSARAVPAGPESPAEPVKVEVIEPRQNALQALRDLTAPLIGPLETAGLVIVFTIFMLIDREDLRNRLLGLIGQQQLYRSTQAMNDAARRVSRYLMVQFWVNTSFGVVLTLGLFLIGVPSSALWGVLAMLLRFLPYVGTVLAGLLPVLLTVATTEGWRAPLLVIILFLTVELVTANLIEPKLYGSQTGLSPVAILTAAVFWTALWGPVGLILSTPLTVCMGVLGRYTPHLQFLNTLLGDEPGLAPDALFYQRLLALEQQDAMAVVDHFVKDRPLVELYDQVIVPALAMAERDRHGGQLEPRREEFVVQSIREFVTELADSDLTPGPKRRNRRDSTGEAPGMETARARRENRVFCVAAHDEADEITAAMLAQLAEREGFPALAFPATDSPVDLLEGLGPQPSDIVCVCAVPPLALTHARTVSQEIRRAFPDVTLLVGLWRYPTTESRTVDRLQQATGSTVVTDFTTALVQVKSAASPTRTISL